MRLVVFALFSSFSQLAFSQKEASHWFFGSKAGLYFDQIGPKPIAGSSMVTEQGCATISDKDTGELIFYSNGRNVWNREHQLMPNGRDFPSDCWSGIAQSALIVPFPGAGSKYYLFSIYYTEELGSSIFMEWNCKYGQNSTEMFREIRYSIVDMSLGGGMGDVVADQKNIRLQLNTTEKIVATPHANGHDYWIISHGFDSNEFYVYPLTGTGISEPTVTAIGSVHQFKSDEFFADDEARGNMKVSPDGRKLACAVATGKRPFDLFDFDAATGEISHYINLGLVQGQYGLSFSPDNSKLYVNADDRPEPSVYPYPDIIIQYDLTGLDDQAIVASRKSIIRDNSLTNIPDHGIFEGLSHWEMGMQLAPDGKIYATADHAYSPNDGHIMVVIEKPNARGIGCQVNYKRFDFADGVVGSGLPNFIDAWFNGIESVNDCSDSVSFSLFPNPATSTVHVRSLAGCDPRVTITVFNTLGQEMATFQNDEELASIDVSSWSSGMYFFVLSTPYGQRRVERVVKV